MRFCFVSTSRGSYFMTELLAALAAATQAAGHVAELTFDEFAPLGEDRIYVVVPHEFDAWGDPSGLPDKEQRARTIALCTENPGTGWFEATYELVAKYGAAVSINRSSAAELRRRGVRCEHLQLGYFAGWDSWRRDEAVERDIDVLYLGAADPRRDPLLAGIGTSLWERNCQFLVPPLEPRTGPRPDFLKEGDKYHRLRQAKVLLNLHRTSSAALEWMRFLEAICNGCVVVSEPCLDSNPLVAGEHFVQATAEQIAGAVDELLKDPERLRTLREQAYDFVRAQLPMVQAGERLAELASELPRQPPFTAAPSAQARVPKAVAPIESPPPVELRVDTGDAARASGARGRAALLHTAWSRLARRRIRAGDTLAQTPSYTGASQRVSVLSVIRADREHHCVELLESVAAGVCVAHERVVLDDASSRDGGRDVVQFFDAHPALPMILLGAQVPGLAAARNLLAARARGEYLLVLTADGGVFPSTVKRLVKALDADPLALFSYPMIAVLDKGVPVDLRGSLPWEPQRLRHTNWIDAPALIRRGRLLELNGYATDPRLDGLEDFDLWCRCAEAAGHGVHVPQVLGWHPPSESAQPLDVAALAPATIELMRGRCPRLFADRRGK
jgi:hypothetical protein